MAENTATEKVLIKHDPAAFLQGAVAATPNTLAADNANEAGPVSLVPKKETTEPITATTEDEPAPTNPAPNADEDDDAKFLEKYNKRFKTSFKTIEEMEKATESKPEPVLLSAEEKAIADEKRKAEALAWKIEQDPKFKTTYEKSIADKEKSDREIALKVFSAKELAKDKTLSPEDIEEMFKDEYNEDADPDSARAKRSLERMADVADSYKKENYGSVDNYEEDYKGFKELEGKYKAFGKQSKDVVEALPSELKVTIPFVGADGKETSMDVLYPITDEDRKTLRKEFNNEDMFFQLGGNNASIANEKLSEEVMDRFWAKNRDKIVANACLKTMEMTEKEVLTRMKSIPNTSRLGGGALSFNGGEKVLVKHPSIAFTGNR